MAGVMNGVIRERYREQIKQALVAEKSQEG